MTEIIQKQSTKETVSTYVYFSSLYFVTVGALYLWGYWATFNVNILEYQSLSDIIKSTAYPIASAFIFSAIGAILGELTSDSIRLPSGGGRDTPAGKLLHKFAPYIVFVYLGGTFALLIFGAIEKWHVLPILFAFPAYAFAKKQGFLQTIIPHDSPRSIVIFLLAILPTFAYGYGRINSEQIVSGKNFQYALSPINNIDSGKQEDPTQRLRFIGHSGDFLFFYEPSKRSLVICKFETGKALILNHYKRPR